LISSAAAALLLAIPVEAPRRETVIDVHMHALAADEQGPPPLGMCTPFPEFAAWDPATTSGAVPGEFKQPACADPICIGSCASTSCTPATR
jgi:hypothetical protein